MKRLETRLQTVLKVEALLCILLQGFLGVGVHYSNFLWDPVLKFIFYSTCFTMASPADKMKHYKNNQSS